MSADLLRQATPIAAVGLVQNYLSIAHRFKYEPQPEEIVRLFREMGYTLRRLPRKANQ